MATASSQGNKRKLTDYWGASANSLFSRGNSNSSELSSISSSFFTPPEYPPSNRVRSPTRPKRSSFSLPGPVTPSRKAFGSSQSSLTPIPPSSHRTVPIFTPRKDSGSPATTPQSHRLVQRHDQSPSRPTPKPLLVIRDSDGEEDSDDLDGLPSTAALLRPSRPSNSSGPNGTAQVQTSIRLTHSSLRDRLEAAARRKPESPPPKPKEYKFSLAKLVSQKEAQNIDDATVASIKDALREKDQAALRRGQPSVNQDDVEQFVETADLEGGEAMKDAIARTEAWNAQRSWRFVNWGKTQTSRVRDSRTRLDLGEIDAADDVAFERALLSGHLAARVAMGQQLPPETTAWMVRQLAIEARDDLRAAYAYTLQTDPQALGNLLTSSCLTSLLRLLGAEDQVVFFGSSLKPSLSGNHDDISLHVDRFCSVLELLTFAAPHVSEEAQPFLLQALARLSLDDEMEYCSPLSESIQHTISALICAPSSDEDWLSLELTWIKNLCTTIDEWELRVRLLTLLPYREPRARTFARRLATAMLCSVPAMCDGEGDNDGATSPGFPRSSAVDSKPIIPRLTQRLKRKSSYHINESTDYVELMHRISVLDIAVGDGTAGLSLQDSGHEMTKAEEHAFNESVDELVAALKKIGNKIMDAGATHHSRMECKQVIERVYQRIAYSVRTRPKVRKGVFSGNAGDLMGMLIKDGELNGPTNTAPETQVEQIPMETSAS